MTRVTDFNNTWCEATEENEKALNKNNIHGFCADTEDTQIYVIKEDKFIPMNKNYFELGYSPKQIKLIGNDFYYVDEEKEEDSFNKLGFETPEFEGEILKEIGDYCIGYYQNVKDNGYYPCAWNLDGAICDGFDRDYNLTPIKKQWYEIEDNIKDKLVIRKNHNELCKVDYLSSDKKYLSVIRLSDGANIVVDVGMFRPSTKEEVLELVIEE